MTITLDIRPEVQAELARQAAAQGRAIEAVAARLLEDAVQTPVRTVAEQGLGLLGSPEDAALLDEVVSLAYADRRRPSQRKPTL